MDEDKLSSHLSEREPIKETPASSYSILRAIVDNTTDAIFVKDMEGRYVMINSAGAQFIGMNIEEIIGRSDAELFSPEVARQNMDNDQRIISVGETQTYEDTEEVDGRQRTFHSTKGIYRDEHGRAIGVFGVSRDITLRKQAEIDRERLIQELRDALAEVKTLRGILPICMYCKKIRDDEGAWTQLELYIKAHTDTDFSHGMCEPCAKKMYPEIYEQLYPDK